MSSVKILFCRRCLPTPRFDAVSARFARRLHVPPFAAMPTTARRSPPMPRQPDLLPRSKSSDHSHRGQPSPGSDRRHPRLGRAATACPADPSGEAEERCRPTTSFACHPRGHGVDGHSQAHLSGGGRPDPILRTCALLVRAHRVELDAGLHHDPGLHRVDGPRGDQTHQSVRGGLGGEEEAGRSLHPGRRHYRAGSGHSLPQRNGADGGFPALGDKRSTQGGRDTEGVRAHHGEPIRCGPTESPGISALRQKQGEKGSMSWARWSPSWRSSTGLWGAH